MPKEPFPTDQDRARIDLLMKDHCSRIAMREKLKGNQLPTNCPFVFWDSDSERFIEGDAFFRFHPNGGVTHQYADVVAHEDIFSMGNHVANTIRVIQESSLNLPLLADEASLNELKLLKGNSVEILGDNDPLHFSLNTPVGSIPVYLPDSSIPFLDLGQNPQTGIGPTDRPLLE